MDVRVDESECRAVRARDTATTLLGTATRRRGGAGLGSTIHPRRQRLAQFLNPTVEDRRLQTIEGKSMKQAVRETIIDLLSRCKDMTIATVRPDGAPQATVVSYVHDGLL